MSYQFSYLQRDEKYRWHASDEVNHLDVHAILNYLMLRTGCKYVSVDIPMPIESEDQIVDLFVQKMESEGDIDFAIIGTF